MSYDDGSYAHCALGAVEVAALEFAAEQNELAGVALDWLAGMALKIQVKNAGHGGSVPSWNDANGRTEAEVRDLMMTAAKDLRNSNNEGE